MGLVKKIGGIRINITPLISKHNGVLSLGVVDNEWWFSRKT